MDKVRWIINVENRCHSFCWEKNRKANYVLNGLGLKDYRVTVSYSTNEAFQPSSSMLARCPSMRIPMACNRSVSTSFMFKSFSKLFRNSITVSASNTSSVSLYQIATNLLCEKRTPQLYFEFFLSHLKHVPSSSRLHCPWENDADHLSMLYPS